MPRPRRKQRGTARSTYNAPVRRGRSASKRTLHWRVGIDTGGTFTDFHVTGPGIDFIFKLPSTPHDPAAALTEGLRRIQAILAAGPRHPSGGGAKADRRAAGLTVVHGTTVGTNALLTRRLSRTAFITTAGFEDLLEIGRQSRPSLYDLRARRAEPLVPRRLRIGVRERIHIEEGGARGGRGYGPSPSGSRPLRFFPSKREMGTLLDRLRRLRVESVAVGFLHSYLDPAHERRVGRSLAALGVPVTLSHKISGEYREYERFSTAVANAALRPVVGGYLATLERAVRGTSLTILQSDGTTASPRASAAEPVRTVLSGPAGGALAAESLARRLRDRRVISYDMGGTSTDAVFFEGELPRVALGGVGGVPLRAPMIEVRTVVAGGGSIARRDGAGALRVGPDSVGADPGPACYGRGTSPTVTDAHLVLGRLGASELLGGALKVDRARARGAVGALARELRMTVEACAEGILEVVESTMEGALRSISLERGKDPRGGAFYAFGGAGGLHACGLAERLGMDRVVIPPGPGVFSATGLASALPGVELAQTLFARPSEKGRLRSACRKLAARALAKLRAQGIGEEKTMVPAVRVRWFVDLRYQGQSHEITVPFGPRMETTFERMHEERYGHRRAGAPIEVVTLRVRAGSSARPSRFGAARALLEDEEAGVGGGHGGPPRGEFAAETTRARERVFTNGAWRECAIVPRASLRPRSSVAGPARITEYSATTFVPEGWRARPGPEGTLFLRRSMRRPTTRAGVLRRLEAGRTAAKREARLDPVSLEVFRGMFVSVCEEMGQALMRSASSTNIKERRDYSCALFDAQGRTIAQGDHMPVHLGSMPASVAAVLAALELGPGDVAILNDPFRGGTHLPDITLVAPVHLERDSTRPSFHVACRAHHSDVGGIQAGSMPLATEIYQEGLIIPPVRLVRAGTTDTALLAMILANVRTPRERREDLAAQAAALVTGARRLREIVAVYGVRTAEAAGAALRGYSERMLRRALREAPSGSWSFEDFLDDDGFGSGPIRIRARVTLRGGRAIIDLRDCAEQVRGGVNAVRAITESCVLYVFRCLVGEDIPSNAGLTRPLTILTRPGSVLDARPPAAVAAGNVETSQRLVDVLLGALARAMPERIPAASQGTMNNVALGGRNAEGTHAFAYYETIAGGAGAGEGAPGASGSHSHMTNSLNTPVEALEQALPLRLLASTLRRGSGGAGRARGGDGILRTYAPLVPTDFAILSDRRLFAPYGLAGGGSGKRGRNAIERSGGGRTTLPGKASGRLAPGDRLIIETPGGGGWGRPRSGR